LIEAIEHIRPELTPYPVTLIDHRQSIRNSI